jgi:alkanesulfonate monooxygenase SsuD/methylene tetrahydromethanopterin reductase-like flavin-dependent oxidoreductase (luciferase family)
MDIGIGLPATIPGVERQQVLDWSREAERRGFSSLGTIDRLVYPNYEPLIALAAAAAVTERIRLLTSILITPLRTNTVLLAKEAATLDALSGGRLVLGVAVGGRDDDFEASGIEMRGRGERFERQIEEMKRIWSGEKLGYAGEIGPTPVQPGGPPLIIGGSVDASFKRAARHGEGWIMGGGAPDQFSAGVEKLKAAWSEAGRKGEPLKMSLAYFSLGPEAEQNADKYLHHYYEWLGSETADAIAGSAATDEDTVRSYLQAFEQAGCDELVLFPCSPEVEQVELLASAAGLG